MNNRGKIGIITCESGEFFADKIIKEFPKICEKEEIICNISLIPTKETHFANTEIKTEILKSIRGMDIYIIQDVANKETGFSIDENIMALKTAIDAADRSDAKHITVIIPAFPYARQDKTISREGISASIFARELEALRVDRIVTLDIHNTAIAGFFRKAILENLSARKNIVNYLKENINIENLVIVAPDEGAVKRATKYAQDLQVSLALMYKQRDYSKASTIADTVLIGEVKDQDCLIVDDMIATGGTMISATDTLKKNGAKDIYLACSLPFFDGNAKEKFNNAYKEGKIKQIIGTNAVRQPNDFIEKTEWYKQVPVSKYFARVIFNINHNISLSGLLK